MPKIVTVIPVKGRGLLVPHTIKALTGIVDHVVCITETKEEKAFCNGATVTTLGRVPLGKKWNGGFQCAKQFDPDYVLFMGSSDFVTPNWIENLLPLAENHEIVGTNDFYELHQMYAVKFDREEKYNREEINRAFMCRILGWWRGYVDNRRGEPIGIGRLIRRDYLKRVDYKPFDDNLVKSLDYSMISKTRDFRSIHSGEFKSLSFSCNLWGNKHSFWNDMRNPGSEIIPDNIAFLTKYFPNLLNLF